MLVLYLHWLKLCSYGVRDCNFWMKVLYLATWWCFDYFCLSWHREDRISAIIPDLDAASPCTNSEWKRPGMDFETPSASKLQKIASGDGNELSSSQNNSRGKQQKREKLDWNVLRPPKCSDQKKLITWCISSHIT